MSNNQVTFGPYGIGCMWWAIIIIITLVLLLEFV